MRVSQTLLKHIPSIKFVGGKHPLPEHIDSSVQLHLFSGGILPGSSEAIKVSSLPKRAPPKPAASKLQQWTGLKPSDKEYQFTSIHELPRRFQPLIIDELELDAVNQGGAGLLI